jgi:5-hydroxyisourate hydrolase
MLHVWMEGEWALVGQARSQENGRVESFAPVPAAPRVGSAATYRLTFDMEGYWASLEPLGTPDAPGENAGPPLPFFPEITVVFRVADPSQHTHVPVVVSPYGYSTYRGN